MRALVCALVLAVPAAGLTQQPAAPDRWAGLWQGELRTPMQTLRLGLTLTRDSVGNLLGGFVSIDQGGARFPATIAVRGDTLLADNAALSVRYLAILTAAGDSVRGTWTQGPGRLPLDMGRVASFAPSVAQVRPQTPKPPYPYHTEAVSIPSVDGVTLAGTLALPADGGPFPVVVFVTGSGAQDRDETLLGHKPFLVIADDLARHGIASLRYDDRGTARSTGTFATATSMDFADDAEAVVRWLGRHPRIDGRRIGILGHSEGGLIAPVVAARNRDVAFVVLLAGPGLPGDSIQTMQQRLIMVAGGVQADVAARNVRNTRRMVAAMRGARDSADADARARAAVRALLDSLPEGERAATARLLESFLPVLTTAWMRAFLAYDPRPTLTRLRIPVLAINGSLDIQVPAKENLAAIDAALRAGGNRDYRVVELPGLNHLFQTATTGNVSEYAKIEETIAPAALEVIRTWIVAHARGGAK